MVAPFRFVPGWVVSVLAPGECQKDYNQVESYSEPDANCTDHEHDGPPRVPLEKSPGRLSFAKVDDRGVVYARKHVMSSGGRSTSE